MAINFFLIYLGSLLACCIVLFTIVGKFATGFAGSGKKPIIYGSFSSLIASFAAFISTYISHNLFTVFWCFSAIFLIFGIIHMLMVHKKYFGGNAERSTSNVIGEILFGLSVILFTIVVFSSLQYFLKYKSFLFYPMMMSTLVFFIPVLVMHTFEAAYSIPAPDYNTWIYPVETALDLPDENPRDKLLVIGFEMCKKSTDSKRTYFRAKAPESIVLGDLFYFFIIDYNELQSETQIEFANRNSYGHEFWFRLKPKWYQRNRILDPSLSVKDNGIVENSVIICERVNKTS